MVRRFRVAFPLITMGLMAITAGLLAYTAASDPFRGALGVGPYRGKPPALARHLETLRQALPGNLGEMPGGPAAAADEAFMARAYPDTDIPLANIEAARAAAADLATRFPRGRGRDGQWVSVGPANALYPATVFRSIYSYVPTDYLAGGRVSALAITRTCVKGDCVLYAGSAGGGIWRTKNALDGQPNWEFLSAPFGINASGTIEVDPNDPSGNTVWVGTGEANASGDSAAGSGIYKSTDGGQTWTALGQAEFSGRSVATIAIVPGSPNVVYAGSTRGIRGVASVSGGGVSFIPGAAAWGLYKSTDGGTTWTFLHNGAPTAAECDTVAEATAGGSPCSLRGVRRIALDPFNSAIVYAGSYQRGVWRSTDAGATWTQIKPSLNAAVNTTRPEIAVAALPDGKTRMYVAEGNQGSPYSRLYRSDDVATGAPVFTDLTSPDPANIGFGSYNICTGQCWYDQFVHTPAGNPDVVYLGGSYQYNESGRISNSRGVVLSTDAGVSFTDVSMDATSQYYPNGLHPDQHVLVTNPNNPFQFFEGNDGGIMRSSGAFADVSAWCAPRGLDAVRQARCEQLLSRVPTKLESLNRGFPTLQFQSLSVSPFNPNILQGGTQDNGTWQSTGNPVKWINTMIGDGGQSGFDAANPNFRFHTFYYTSPDVNFSKGDIADWNWIGDPIFTSSSSFYPPVISDPVVSKTMFAGNFNVYRTKTWGMGTMTLAEFRQHCNEWYGDFAVQCGDWVAIATPTLSSSARGDRSGGFVTAVERVSSNTATAWASTSTGRVFISLNVDAEPAAAVTWTRLDGLAGNDPNRFVTSIHVDPANPNRAWVSYSGFDATTPATPGHVFEVVYDPGAGTATWTDLSYDFGDIPVNDLVRDDPTGDLYASSDFGVYRLGAGDTTWTLAAPGMPRVEVAGLTIVPAARKLYAATHGMSAWLLNLP
jgi:photosystem II stability/assembly factor-like uncharacterized protein